MGFVSGLLLGLLGSIFIVPFVLWIYTKIKNTKERRSIKRQITRGEFIKPMEQKDYDTKVWGVLSHEDPKARLESIFKPQEIKNE